ASFLAVGQQISGPTNTPAQSDSQANYRADIEIEMPLGQFESDSTEGVLFTHFRMGQGAGVGTGPVSTFTGAVNSTTFALTSGNRDESSALLAQMWYQLSTSVNASEQGEQFDRLAITVGKIDPFVFFDNNSIADDESEAFVNNVFVHNPHLDSGGDIGADDFGFSPGVVAAYTLNAHSSNQWTASVGLFGAGGNASGSGFNNAFRDPFSIAQLQYEGDALAGMPGTYQVYAWHNPQSTSSVTNATENHSGLGVSISQELAKTVTVFTRLGYQLDGDVNFDSSLTAGLQVSGNSWGRGQDRVGFALGGLFASDEYKAANAGAKGSETNAEVYYTYQINDHLHVSPHIVYVDNPAALPNQDDITVVGLRTKASF
ncbi:MAG: carbohydrate porin, partial [Limnobacter sp.]|nr:carbohydrate porin [Limnobacter sp.]